MSINTTNLTEVDVLNGTATSTANAATINTQSGLITTESLTTAAGGTYVMTLTNSLIKAGSIVNVVAGNGTNAVVNAGLVPVTVTPTAGSARIILQNVGAASISGTMKIGFTVFNLV